MIFVDTSGWFAGVVDDDIDHSVANLWFAENDRRLVTTDYIIDETLTLLRSRGQSQMANLLADRFF